MSGRTFAGALGAFALAPAAAVGQSAAFVAPGSRQHAARHVRETPNADFHAEPEANAPAAGAFAPSTTALALAGVGVAVAAGRRARRSGAVGASAAAATAVRAFEGELGVQAPVGFWDPLGLSADGDSVAFKRRRVTEIKHGRISMLACMGYITPELVGKFPGSLSPSQGIEFADVPNGLAAISKIPSYGWFQIIAYCLYCEASALNFGYFNEAFDQKAPGDYGWRPPLLATDDAALKTKRLNAELANGRLAMVAIIGMFFQDGLTGSAWGDWSLYTESPLRAFESELGVQAPVGFWDPLGFCKDADQIKFKRRRQVELKHGRVCMLACLGYITPEYFRLPGYLSTSLGLQFNEVPNGLAAIGKVPVAGGLQMFFFAGAMERGLLQQDPSRDPGDFANIGNLGVPYSEDIPDPEARKRSLNAELANGRLAMVAIMGMMFQDGTFGTTGPEMWLPGSAFENELGVQPPFGFWDPLGLSKDGDADDFYRRRCTEIKHGRISMIACIGYITPEYFKFPGFCSPTLGVEFTYIPNGLAALKEIPAPGIAQWFLFCGFCEVYAARQDPKDPPGKLSGNDEGFEQTTYGNLGLYKGSSIADPDKKKRGLNSEIANGRLAMMAIIGMFFQDGLTGSAWGDWANYVDSPLRAFESELGVQAPVGFWDPVGFCQDGDSAKFNRRRATELKHGRVSMLACIGYITPEFFKMPGYLSPSLGVNFADIPNGLGAIAKVPAAGWAQIAAWCAFCEVSQKQAPGTPAYEGNFGFKAIPESNVYNSADPAQRRKKLNAELANGRLAMVAIIGMFFQDGLTGSAWGDWDLYTASPLRAFEKELGVQDPVGFWDPLGFTKDGDAAAFKRRRAVELKHGRVSMYACIGYFVPEYTKFGGYLSPSMGLKFSDVPNGLGAFSKVPLAGWAQIVAFCGFIENTGFFQGKQSIGWMTDASMTSAKGEPGNYGLGWIGAFNTLKPIPVLRQRKLNAELANGRLAMTAIMAMLFQNGTVGSTGPEMWAAQVPEYANTVGDFVPKNV